MTGFLDQYAGYLGANAPRDLPLLSHYLEWRVRRAGAPFVPDADDDVEIRSYLVHLRSGAGDMDRVRGTIAALKKFYAWAQNQGLIATSPFSLFNFDRPLLSREQIRRRAEVLSPDPAERELARLRGLNQLGDQLNRSPDIATTLRATLATLVEAMQLKTAWAYLWNEAGLPIRSRTEDPSHGFLVVESCGLPPGLEAGDCERLRCSPRCHCQDLLCAGRLVRAVNVVECTRLRATSRASGETHGLLFHATVPLVSQGRSLGMINVATDKWELLSGADLQFLSVAGTQVAVAIERACLYEEAEWRRSCFARELEMARHVQQSLLPGRMPVISGFSLAAEWQSAGEVAGDFYDAFLLPDGRWGLVIADVSGKGAPAALYMAMVRSLIRSEAERGASASATLAAVNRNLQAHSAAKLFVTVFYGILDPGSRSLTYSLAGHEPPLLRRSSGEIIALTCGGLMLGPFADAMLSEAVVRLEPGETVIVYTDGVTEAANSQGEFFGMKRLTDAMVRVPRSAEATLAKLQTDVAAFVGKAPRSDDLTVLVLEATEPPILEI